MNDLSANPWVLDTPAPFVPGAGPIQPAVLWRDQISIHHIELVNYTTGTAGKAIVKNRNGQIVAVLTVLTTDDEEKRTATVGWVQGLIFDTLTTNGGQVLVYLRP